MQIPDLQIEPLRQAGVVAVHARDELAAGDGEKLVEVLGEALVGFVSEQADARVGVLLEALPGVVGGGIVHYEKLEIAERLIEDALHGLVHERAAVVHRHQDADEGGAHGNSFSF